MKKERLVLFIFLAIILSTLVSAYGYYDLSSSATQLIDWIKQIFSPFLGAFLGGEGDLLFERVLFLTILISFVYVILSNIPLFEGKEGSKWLITFAVSILATRFLTETEVVKSILLPYQVLGITLTAAIPLIVFFVFVYKSFESSVIRKVCWIFFLVVFLGLWWSRYSELGKLSWIYFATGVFALIFLLADGTIRRALIKQQMKELGFNTREDLAREINRQIRLADQDLANGIIAIPQHRKIKRRLRKQLEAIYKN